MWLLVGLGCLRGDQVEFVNRRLEVRFLSPAPLSSDQSNEFRLFLVSRQNGGSAAVRSYSPAFFSCPHLILVYFETAAIRLFFTVLALNRNRCSCEGDLRSVEPIRMRCHPRNHSNTQFYIDKLDGRVNLLVCNRCSTSTTLNAQPTAK